MNNADLLMAALRQTAAGKAGAKGGLNGGAHAKDGKEKADHFREQLRLVSKETKTVTPRAAKTVDDAKIVDAKPMLDAASVLAELTSEVAQKPNVSDDQTDDDDSKATKGDESATKSAPWRGPDPALSAVMAKLDHAHSPLPSDDKAASRISVPDVKADDASLDPTKLIHAAKADEPDADTAATQRFTLTVETTDTKPLPAAKAVVREQETHFEPVQQVTTLQKIVDRMATDLAAVASPEGARAADAPGPEAHKVADSRPVRMMTLELDPPNLGSVTVKMRLAGDSVEIHLTADRYETTQMLRQERGALTDAMQSAGYTFDIAAIDHTQTPDANLNNGQQQQQAPSDQRSSLPSSGGSQADGGSSGRSSGDAQSGARHNRQDHEQSPRSSERQQDQANNRVRSSTVYI
ncbi:flagellar hook-length control protein FliK [Tardiphaga sp. P9-11]|jgi:chemotaxis protein MotD|uniref:flagellar hook-length control protein FliK n=1 Tax=Tardiphaga sp. P9-11 TaxID=2024614 RepID=UPI0011F290FA|nr:flagellar hook-length control protein FliK [Tardiphaga sp. P9-11]KAA0078059.1 flagellar hook-length control protein FliK [Tardiphaga sp. P9-11]